jgi:hypothetical protein
MSYAKTSRRAEQRDLRDKMRGLGLDHRQIAFEFARRYNLRPRPAWRNAHGWSLQQAAEQINTYARGADLDHNGTTVTMTGPHLCEAESWPGHTQRPTGRRPTPYLLTLLAIVYGCTVADLLDLADYEHMPPADLLILGKTVGLDGDSRLLPQCLAPVRPSLAATVAASTGHPDSSMSPPTRRLHTAPDRAWSFAERSMAPELSPLAGAMLSTPQAADVARDSMADDAANIWRLRQAAQYQTLARMLPEALARARAGEMGLSEDRQIASALTHLYNAASSLARAFGSLELAG